MSDATSAIFGNITLPPTVTTEQLPVDLLNRQALVDQIIYLLDILSDTRGSCTLVLNGKRDSGKTFVLNIWNSNYASIKMVRSNCISQ